MNHQYDIWGALFSLYYVFVDCFLFASYSDRHCRSRIWHKFQIFFYWWSNYKVKTRCFRGYRLFFFFFKSELIFSSISSYSADFEISPFILPLWGSYLTSFSEIGWPVSLVRCYSWKWLSNHLVETWQFDKFTGRKTSILKSTQVTSLVSGKARIEPSCL